MADQQIPGANRIDLRVGGKYRLGKKIGSGSFGGSPNRYYITLWCTHSIFRRYLPRHQHHFRRGSRHQARICQG